MTPEAGGRTGGWPFYGWLGLSLVALFWPLNWFLSGIRTHWGFFPLWLGYALTADALAFRGKGNSPLTRNPAAYAGLFLASAPAWCRRVSGPARYLWRSVPSRCHRVPAPGRWH